MVYTVKYKLKNQSWKKIKNVKGDLIVQDLPNPTRVLILDDETRIEIPYNNTVFVFSKERFIAIKQSAERETGQKINI